MPLPAPSLPTDCLSYCFHEYDCKQRYAYWNISAIGDAPRQKINNGCLCICLLSWLLGVTSVAFGRRLTIERSDSRDHFHACLMKTPLTHAWRVVALYVFLFKNRTEVMSNFIVHCRTDFVNGVFTLMKQGPDLFDALSRKGYIADSAKLLKE